MQAGIAWCSTGSMVSNGSITLKCWWLTCKVHLVCNNCDAFLAGPMLESAAVVPPGDVTSMKYNAVQLPVPCSTVAWTVDSKHDQCFCGMWSTEWVNLSVCGWRSFGSNRVILADSS
jgi:hypothetical protein